MPHYAYLVTDLHCPSCDVVVADRVWFQWGYSPGYLPREGHLYHLNDAIRWQWCEDGGLFSWAYFKDPVQSLEGADIGDPAIRDLIVRDTAQFYWRDPAERRQCEKCQQILEGAAIEIRDNIIRRSWIYQPGEFDNEVDIYVLRANGQDMPMPEWNDHAMASVYGCSEHRLIVP